MRGPLVLQSFCPALCRHTRPLSALTVACPCPPIAGFPKIAGGTGGYCRLVAICPPEWPEGVVIADGPLPEQPHPLRRGSDGVLVPTEGATPTRYCPNTATGAWKEDCTEDFWR